MTLNKQLEESDTLHALQSELFRETHVVGANNAEELRYRRYVHIFVADMSCWDVRDGPVKPTRDQVSKNDVLCQRMACIMRIKYLYLHVR